MRTIRLYGELGKKYGRVHKFDVKSVGEAVRALCANFKSFKQHLVDSGKREVGYEIWDGKRNVEQTDESIHQHCSDDIKIIPRIVGSSNAAKIVIGVILIIVSWWMGGAAGWAYLGAQGYMAATAVFMMGASAIMQGIIGYMTKASSGSSIFNESDDSSSYVFSGPTNATKQGNPVFIGYGEMIVGSQVIGATLTTADL